MAFEPQKILDAHTHLSVAESGETPDHILASLDACGAAGAFLFAPLLDSGSWQLTDGNLADIKVHNDYCAHVCSSAPDRLYGFCVLNPAPQLAGGSLKRAVNQMIKEAQRCYHTLGLRGVKLVPGGWYPHDPELIRSTVAAPRASRRGGKLGARLRGSLTRYEV